MIDFFRNLFTGKVDEKYPEIQENKQIENVIVRKKVIFKGRVQGVGFRFEAYSTAVEKGLTGYVKNQEDLSVLLEVQGDKQEVFSFIEYLTTLDRVAVDDVEIFDLEVKGFETSFKIAC